MELEQLIERIALEELGDYNSNLQVEDLLKTRGLKSLVKDIERCSVRYQIDTLREFFDKQIEKKK